MFKVALIGSNGQLGSDIVKVFEIDSSFSLIPLTHNDIDITNNQKTKEIIEKMSPNIVINTAAYHKVDEVENNPQKAFLINAIAEKNLAYLCQKNNWTLVFISTDYVFGSDYKRKKPYLETDNPGPINVYGISKLAGEYFTRYTCKKYFIIRTSGLFGAAGSSGKGKNFVELMISLAKKRRRINVVDDQILTPTYTINLAENLKDLIKTKHYGLYHITPEGECSWWKFAREIFKLLKMNVKCNKVDSIFFKTKAKRPNFSVLENANLKKINLNLMKHWKKNLKLYLKERGYLS